ncbi:hypothetical protein DQG23_24275 [Paenibacillus contaminans]|uniref:WYL domain-containing protein n=1 Tax=Paenibacillus contaminans TaxID=450362 RepID=A0A329MG05_9BACL|nr:hypothetical protein DQG23_24275 [Paenibacillus contaminans]
MQKYVGQVVELVYLDRRGKITQRRVEVREVAEEIVKAYCLVQRGPRIFRVANILAIQPVRKASSI